MIPSVRKLLVAAVVVTAACAGGDADGDAAAGDTLSRAQRDSIIGASSLPGAGAVQRALDTSDSAAARLQAMDTIGGTP